jgi:putative inorganic carbon (hco3(-)) transporter
VIKALPLRRIFPFAASAALGAAMAVAVSRLLTLEFRYLAAACVGIAMITVSMVFISRLRDLLFYLLAFNLAFTSIEKTLLRTDSPTFVSPGIGVGLADLTLGLLYMIWIARILIKRDRLPRVTGLDFWVLAFVGAHALSLLASINESLTVFETIRVTKYALVYFYIAHNLRRYHIPYLVAGVLCALTIQASLGVVQQRTGRLMGIGRTKGAELSYEQYAVAGFEAVRRAEGTTFDSHAFGLYCAMVLPIPIMLGVARGVPPYVRVLLAGGFAAGVIGVAISFSRAGWLSTAVAVLILAGCFVRWREWRLLRVATTVGLVLAVVLTVPFARQIKQRLFEAPLELVEARFETYETAYTLWTQSPYLGLGANTYMFAMESRMGMVDGEPYFIPPHNMLLLQLTELGPLGVLAFLGLTVSAIRRGFRVVVRSDDQVLRSLAAALMAAAVVLHVEGLTDPIYVTNVTYYLFWFELGFLGGVYALATAAQRSSVPARAPVPSLPSLSPATH